MAKRSKRRNVQQNKDQAGCMWGLISIFDFRHGRTTRRLLSDKRLMAKNTVVSAYPTAEVNILTSSEERHVSIENVTKSEKPTLDVVKTSVKALMEEEMVSEQDSTQQTDGNEVEFGNHVKNHKHTEKTSNDHETSQYRDLEALMKEILMIYHKRNDREGDHDGGVNRSFSIVEEKLSAAIEVFMNENSSGQKTRFSKDFIDTFQMLTSNKELFLKLLQDQDSILLKNTQGSEDVNGNEDQKSNSKSTEKSNLLEKESRSDVNVPVTRKHRNFFRRRSKSQESISLNEEQDSPLRSSRIVILKPNSLNNRFKMENDVHSERISSHFSFMDIKKRLRNAMGKEQMSEKTVLDGSSGWSSPNRDHFYTERFAKRIERVSKLHESETKQRENDKNGDFGSQISSIYIEAKKHLSEMLNGGDEDTELMMENLPKSLGKILSFPEYNSLSPHGSFVTVNESQPCSGGVDLLDEVNLDTNFEGAVEIEKPENREEMEVLDVSCEQCSSRGSIDDDHHGEIFEVIDEERSPECLKSDLHEENEFSSPKGSLIDNNIEEPESTSSDRTGRPSPVSVLEPFSDNEISPASTISRPVEAAIQPLCIKFEDLEMCTRNCMQNEESAFEYVEALLLASDLNWDEFEKRWLSSIQILDSSLFNELEIFSSWPSHEQRLLFDSTNQILKEVCDCYLDFVLQLSFTKRKIQPVPKGVNLVNEVWERIESHLNNNYPLSLDHLVKKDWERSRTWMDLRFDSREMVFEIGESIFEDVMDDTLLSLVDDYVDNQT